MKNKKKREKLKCFSRLKVIELNNGIPLFQRILDLMSHRDEGHRLHLSQPQNRLTPERLVFQSPMLDSMMLVFRYGILLPVIC